MNNPYSQHPQQYEGNRDGRFERASGDDNRGPQSWREDSFNRPQNRPSWSAQQGGYGPSRYSPNFSGDQGEGQWGLGQTGQRQWDQQYLNEYYGYERNPSPQSWGSQSPSGYSTAGQPTGAFGLEQTTHRGKGPKGYTRTDERIREEICECLSDDHRIDASEISVAVKEGVVTLEGSVFDRAQKHRVEDIADRCSGVKDVQNSLRVTQHAGSLTSVEKGQDKSAGKSH